MSILSRVNAMSDLFGLGADALIEVLAGIVDGLGTGTEFTGEQLDRLGELFQQGADKVRALQSGGDQDAGATAQ